MCSLIRDFLNIRKRCDLRRSVLLGGRKGLRQTQEHWNKMSSSNKILLQELFWCLFIILGFKINKYGKFYKSYSSKWSHAFERKLFHLAAVDRLWHADRPIEALEACYFPSRHLIRVPTTFKWPLVMSQFEYRFGSSLLIVFYKTAMTGIFRQPLHLYHY